MSQTPQPPPPYAVIYASPGATPPPPKSAARGLFGWVLFIGLAVMLFIVLQSNKGAAANLPLSAFYAELASSNVVEVIVDGDVLRVRLAAPIKSMAGTTFRVDL